ncbi:lysylphosphatidylglycerol synthase transmembrane domain-containing protein [Dongia soli]|uniref:Lysylphosphatidylglycerol synthase transmembrane domain-containing protein n=1 Tax=Dongia soli TaxID=600628 RepID=A0ABU5ECF7_9PROT|nr:lysylphosphatidylglycerol synthase transmembrane domain-containing protein [Dongia soli]MDY0884056.1 lysylphosphatidylglycerol synthase transmembrane domain-containing protein [Dongia soli]
MPGDLKKWLIIGIQIAVSAALIMHLAQSVSAADLGRATRNLSLMTGAASLGVLGVSHLLGAYRVGIILRALGVDIPYRRAIALSWLGLFASNFLPSTIGGDAVIAASLKRHRYPLTHTLSGLVLNRLAAVMALVTALPCLLLIDGLEPLRPLILQCILWLAVAISTLGLGLAAVFWTLKWSAVFKARLFRLREAILDLFADILSIKPVFAAAWLVSLLMLMVGSASIAILAEAQGPAISYAAVFGVVLIFLAVQMIPLSFNGIGLQESVITFCLVSLGWPTAEALALSIAIRLVATAVSLPGVLVVFAKSTHFVSRPTAPKQ